MNWIDIAAPEDIPLRGARVVKTSSGCIALFRTGEGEIFAISNVCPHKGGPLSEGIVHDRAVTCPLHNQTFSLVTGGALGADEGAVQTFPVKIKDGRILLDTDALVKPRAA